MARLWREIILNKRTMADGINYSFFITVALLATSAFSFEICDVTAMLLHFHQSKMERLFSDGQHFLASIMASRRQGG